MKPAFRSLTLILPLVSSLSNLFTNGLRATSLGNEFGLPAHASFDYVIVGGGTAGPVIATRLAEDPPISVADVEAGGFYEIDAGNQSVVPGYTSWYTGSDPKDFHPLIEWGFTTIPQVGANDRRIHYTRGKALGGTSARNYMIYQRSTVQAQQMWADQVGGQSYTWENILPFYRKHARYTPLDRSQYTNSTNSQDDSAFSDSGGPLQVSFGNWVDSFGTWSQRALINAGMNLTRGFHSGSLIGSAYGTLSIDPRNAQRSSSESSYLQASLQNGSAPMVYKNSFVRRIMFNGTAAIGVLVTMAGSHGVQDLNFTLTARKEVISCAGAIQSPQFLMVSGIGPRQILSQYNIPVLKKPSQRRTKPARPHLFRRFLPRQRPNIQRTTKQPQSPRPQHPPLQRIRDRPPLNPRRQLLRLGKAAPTLLLPTHKCHSHRTHRLPRRLARNRMDPHERLQRLDYQPRHRRSERWLQLCNDADHARRPAIPRHRIDPKHRYDGPAAHRSQLPHRALRCRTRRPNGALPAGDLVLPHGPNLTIGEEYFPGAHISIDSAILAFVQNAMSAVWHAAATCKMGRANDTQAVVDSHARVFGVKNLRVVDASSFPFHPPGHPQATIYALAEKIAAEIRGVGVEES